MGVRFGAVSRLPAPLSDGVTAGFRGVLGSAAAGWVGAAIFLAYLVPPSILFIPLATIVQAYGLALMVPTLFLSGATAKHSTGGTEVTLDLPRNASEMAQRAVGSGEQKQDRAV